MWWSYKLIGCYNLNGYICCVMIENLIKWEIYIHQMHVVSKESQLCAKLKLKIWNCIWNKN
jgi:hypothetical protein